MTIKRIVLNILRSKYIPNALRGYAFSRKFLGDHGWFRSWDLGRPVDNAGNPIPWFTYPSIHFIEQRLDPSASRVFEYGSGNSTIWFSSRVKSIHSVESDKSFYDSLAKTLSSHKNVSYELKESGTEYARRILDFKKEFHIIIIDGKERVECAKNCLEALREDGVIIFDNSDRKEYREAYDFLTNNGFKCLDFKGPGPLVYAEWQTSIYYRDTNCLGI